ncbi:peroxiredoxin [Fluviibacterium sp. DFM31]|uniref:Glutathione-dependent peroxiredoxin n=1 Tax=Meridianimarinicoccus marinus TaxID=3231483 RepID=A0ABV3L6Y5_9RHOB
MPISQGDTLPDATLMRLGAEGPETVELSSLTKGRKIVLAGLPGAYTGPCTEAHIPSYVRTIGDLKAKGIDDIVCVIVNDPFVAKVWGDTTGAAEAGIHILCDPEGTFIHALGLEFTAPAVGLIDRSQRFAMIVDDGKVSLLNVEPDGGVCNVSAGETLLETL